MIIWLGVMSVLMFASLLVGSGKIAAIGLFLWITTVFVTLFRITGFSISQFSAALFQKSSESYDNKQYGKAGVYAVTIPLMIMGLVVVVLQLGVLFFAE